MTRKAYMLVIGITGAVAAGAAALVTYLNPAYATAINSAIVIAETAVGEICSLFVKE